MIWILATPSTDKLDMHPIISPSYILIPQQSKRMGSSAPNYSGVHWCRPRVRFNDVPEKVPKVPEKVPGGFAEPGQVQQGSGEGSGEGLGGFGAKPSQVQQDSGEGSGEGVGARSGSTGFPKRFRRRSGRLLVQTQVRFNRVPEKVLEKVLEKVWEALVQSQARFNRGPEKVPEKGPEKVPGGFGAEPGQVQQGSQKGSGEGVGGFGAEPGQVQQGSGEGFGEGVGGFGAETG